MPRFAANLTMLFTEVPFLDRFAAAARAGFDAVEYLFPYDHDPRQLRALLDEHRLTQVLHNLPAGDWAAGERGIACDPERTGEFAEGVERAVDYAVALGCRRLNCLAGIVPPGVNADTARSTLIANLELAARRLAGAGIRLLVEPVNTRDVPGFFLHGTGQAVDVLRAVGSDNVFLQYDAYHMQVMAEDPAATIQRHLPVVGHVQIADAPGRHEPGTGRMDFNRLFATIDRVGYAGWVGCEYNPAGRTEEGLGWLQRYRR
jgi:hydroxypyruvate isomerase